MEGLAKLVPCNGKGKTIAEVYAKFNEDDIERIISEGVSDKNQCMSMEIDDASEIEDRAVRAHAAVLGRSSGRTEDDILGFYFKMKHLGDH